jgi:hypothetical protein
LTLDAMEFIRRFSLHILPKAFVPIRLYGILISTSKRKTIEVIKKQSPPAKQFTKTHQTTPHNQLQYTCCKRETIVQLFNFNQGGPPVNWKLYFKKLLQQFTTL